MTPTPESGLRARRVAARVREQLTSQLVRQVADPKLAALVVTGVELPDDLSVAHVKVRLLVGGDDPKARKLALSHLGRVAGRLRRGLGPALQLKRVPELRFVYDEGADATLRVEELLAEIEADRRK